MKLSICLVVALVLFLGEPIRGDGDLTPPAGNSLTNTVKTVSAYKVFTCYDSTWSCSKVYAGLVEPDSNALLGNYSAGVVNSSGEVGTWTLKNSAGDQAEGGSTWSSVTGVPVATTSDSDMLFQAKSHQNSGAAAAISYVQMKDVVGGQQPGPEKCTSSSGQYSVTMPFSANYDVWTQDPVPTAVPSSLIAPGRVVVGFFGEGTMDYSHDGSKWQVTSRQGTLYSAPGQAAIGTFSLKDKSEMWQLSNPNGISLKGTQVSLADPTDSCAWSLSKVSSSSSPSSVLGPITHVQMISTRGGKPPTAGLTELGLKQASAVPFSAIFWLYTSQE